MSADTRKWTLEQAIEVAHAAGFVGKSWFMTPEELAHVLNTAGAVPPAPRKAALEPVVEQADGWLQDGGLLYRLTDGRRPESRDEINVTMADCSRSPEARARRAGELLDRIRATRPAAAPAVPPNWLIEPCPELSPTALVVRSPKYGPGSMTVESDHANLATRMLYCLASDLIAADRNHRDGLG